MTKIIKSAKALTLATLMATSVSACSWLTVYKIDIPQGTPISYTQAASVKQGMTVAQVQQLLGSPAVYDALAPAQLDYMYSFIPGSYADRAGVPETQREQRFSVIFDKDGKVLRTQGLNTIPGQQISLPRGKDARFY